MTTPVEMSSMLARMRAMEQMASADQARPANVLETQQPTDGPAFSQLFRQAIDQVNDLNQNSGALAQSYVRGEGGVDITQVMVASQKSSIATQATIQVRNRLVESYQEIMRMSV